MSYGFKIKGMDGLLKIGDKVDCSQEKMKVKLSDYNLIVGDLVREKNGNKIYRIISDHNPRVDAVWGILESKYRMRDGRTFATKTQCWIDAKKKRIAPNKLYGYITVVHVFSFFPKESKTPRKQNFAYHKLKSLKKIDVLSMAQTFAGFQIFLNEEVKRMSSE